MGAGDLGGQEEAACLTMAWRLPRRLETSLRLCFMRSRVARAR